MIFEKYKRNPHFFWWEIKQKKKKTILFINNSMDKRNSLIYTKDKFGG